MPPLLLPLSQIVYYRLLFWFNGIADGEMHGLRYIIAGECHFRVLFIRFPRLNPILALASGSNNACQVIDVFLAYRWPSVVGDDGW
jgi:hypothetical protein